MDPAKPHILLTLVCLLFLTLSGPAKAGGAEEAKRQVLRIFSGISSMDRRSGHEDQVRQWIIAEARKARRQWRKPITWESDRVGNLLIRLPATGRFSDSTFPIALQAHLDMVAAVKGVLPGTDMTPWFKDGVKLETVGGWLQSVGNLTSIGADNGIGVAMALRYLLHPEIPHPPLELLFTIEEETTFAGAKNLNFSLMAPVIFNLDGEAEDEIWVGSQGYYETIARIDLPSTGEVSTPHRLRVVISGLKGGHSAMAIGQNRLNAALLGISLVESVQGKIPDVSLLSFGAGDESVTNVIPNAVVIELAATSDREIRDAEEIIREKWRSHLALAKGENAGEAKLDIGPVSAVSEKRKGLSGTSLTRLLRGMQSLRNGVIAENGIYPGGVNTSSNVSFLFITPSDSGFSARSGYLIRSFETPELDRWHDHNEGKLLALADPTLGFRVDLKSDREEAWKAESSWALDLFQQLAPSRRATRVCGALETGPLSRRYPGRPILVFGPKIRKPHDPKEGVWEESIGSSAVLLDYALEAFPSSPHFRLSCSKLVR